MIRCNTYWKCKAARKKKEAWYSEALALAVDAYRFDYRFQRSNMQFGSDLGCCCWKVQTPALILVVNACI
jgi:hypothetical protein